jgi:hypothetical protein
MKLTRILILMVAVVALTGSANALITFDEFAVGTVITNQYAAQGVIFAGLGGNPPIIAMDGGLQVLSPNPPYAGDFLAAYFSNPVDWVEFDAGYWNEVNTGIIKLYDPYMNLLGQFTNQYTYLDLGYNYEHFSFHGYGPIGAVYFNSYADLAGAAMDNLDFGAGAAIPEPATVVLVGLGLLGLGARLRKR